MPTAGRRAGSLTERATYTFRTRWWRVGLALFATFGIVCGLLRLGGEHPAEQLESAYYAARYRLETICGHPEEPAPGERFEVRVWVDPTRDRHPISPAIYGMAMAPAEYLKDLRLGCNRWGGNQSSRYNWVHGNATSAARDWHWANRPVIEGLPASPSSAADRFIQVNRAAGVNTLLTIPTLGWVARDAALGNRSLQVPERGGSLPIRPFGLIAGYDPTINRRRTSLPSFARKPDPFADPPARDSLAVYQDEWVHHLTQRFGTAAGGGVRYYALDNEPDLWANTHTDVQPAHMGCEELLGRFLEYADAVKQVDPTAAIAGPVASGWTGYLYAPLDEGTNHFRSHPDRDRHGGEPFLLWFLKQVRAHDLRIGRRTLDILDVHYYPQAAGVFSPRADPAMRRLRLRATRSLWDAGYLDESWIQRPIRLLPRLREWIEAGYPGTRIGVSEWNFGGEADISGALAVAETLGLFGREDVALANYWAYPPPNSPAYLAFKLFRNADGKGHGFGDLSCQAVSASPRRVSCFAATESGTGAVTLCLINKTGGTATVPVQLTCTSSKASECQQWRLAAEMPGKIVEQRLTGASSLILMPYSVTLIRIAGSR